MKKYHINVETGEVSACKATKGNCPFKGFDDENIHYANPEEAHRGYESIVERLNKDFVDSKKLLKEIPETLDAQRALRYIYSDTDYLLEDYEKIDKGIVESEKRLREAYQKNQLSVKRLQKMGLMDESMEFDVSELPDVKASNKHYRDFSKVQTFDEFYEKWDHENGYFEDKNFQEDSAYDVVENDLAAWSGMTKNEAFDTIENFESSSKDDSTYQEYLTEVFKNNFEKDKNFVFVDLETTGFTPTTGEIIEIGIAKYDNDGNLIEKYSQRFDIENKALRDEVGLGAEHIHNIHPEDVSGLTTFSEESESGKIRELLNDENSVLVAHNANFEKTWLNHYSPSFRSNHDPDSFGHIKRNEMQKAFGREESDVQRVIDTKNLAMFFGNKGDKTNLSVFSENNGVPYVNAHNAISDAEMTAKAFFNFRKNFTEK